MNKKGALFFSFFIAALLVPHLILHFRKAPGQVTVLAFIPIVFSLVYIIKCITLLIDQRFREMALCFLIAILFISITLKVEYSIYNIFIVSLLCAIGILYLLKRGMKERRPTILALLIALNVLLILIPDKLFYGHIWNLRTWSEDLSWSSFRNTPDAGSEFDAETSSSIYYKVNYAYNYPPALIIALMDEDSSWTKSQNDNLLHHEKGHLDMNEIYSRKAQDSVKTAYLQPPEQIGKIISYFVDESLRQQRLYDAETDHSANLEQQKAWTEKLDVLLKK